MDIFSVSQIVLCLYILRWVKLLGHFRTWLQLKEKYQLNDNFDTRRVCKRNLYGVFQPRLKKRKNVGTAYLLRQYSVCKMKGKDAICMNGYRLIRALAVLCSRDLRSYISSGPERAVFWWDEAAYLPRISAVELWKLTAVDKNSDTHSLFQRFSCDESADRRMEIRQIWILSIFDSCCLKDVILLHATLIQSGHTLACPAFLIFFQIASWRVASYKQCWYVSMYSGKLY